MAKVVATFWLIASSGVGAAEPVLWSDAEIAVLKTLSPLPELPPSSSAVADNELAAKLGKQLFFDTRLSTNDRSCATCHDPEKGFADGRPLPVGSQRGRHTPSLWNVAYQRWFFWDGRADSLWAQALGPMEHADEMGSDRARVVELINSDQDLAQGYESLFGDVAEHAVDQVFANIGKLLEAYERTLVTGPAPFDVFVDGLVNGNPSKLNVLSASAQRGLKLFTGSGGCIVCHSGPILSDMEFHDLRFPTRAGRMPDSGRFGGVKHLKSDPFNALGAYNDSENSTAADRVRFLLDDPSLWGQFKTPSLRNVALTAPYMHDGHMPDLVAVIEYYSTLTGARPADHHDEATLVARRFTAQQKSDLLAFLNALTESE